ncbi:MAG: Ku protein, partial [Thermoleophilia bacterium]|nr:Ku protein [Thermoleophilia bacterium]
LWNGAISFGLVTIPVSLYPAKNAQENVTFRMLHGSDMRRVRNRWVDDEGHEVPFEEIVKGYEYEKDRYVVVDQADLKAAGVESTQSIDIMHFVDAAEIDISFYDTPYYTAPNKPGHKAYALLRETLKRTGKVGVAKVVIRERQHLCAVLPDGPALLAYTLRWPYQLRDASDLELPREDLDGLAVSPQELKMAEQLVEAMTTAWEPEQYRDTYRDDLLRLIDQKVKTGDVVAVPDVVAPAEGEAEVVDIMELLKRSVAERKGGAGRRAAGTLQ